MEDLKCIDVEAMGIVFFMPLNSNLKHPFSADLSSSQSSLERSDQKQVSEKRETHTRR